MTKTILDYIQSSPDLLNECVMEGVPPEVVADFIEQKMDDIIRDHIALAAETYQDREEGSA